MSIEQFERGLKVRKEVLGEDHVKASFDSADSFNRDFQNTVTEYCWGGTWG
jgi:4-carboxymuconolactone decarboxylase